MADVKIKHPRGSADTLSIAGKSYTAEKGVFTVPHEDHAALIKAHGFKIVESKPDPKAEAKS
jgi:hypothetical protein